ncbi:hypothetical protein CK228_25205 [Mesorhizobium sp. WSM4312]|nr:hypothetical protein CK228_25205 [Mesorhizobium sp. WSM4312]PBC19319.1 hypothetical protein CK226_29785 [Mesorhizobium sp. WSM4311]
MSVIAAASGYRWQLQSVDRAGRLWQVRRGSRAPEVWRDKTSDMIGLTDFDLPAPELAHKFRLHQADRP